MQGTEKDGLANIFVWLLFLYLRNEIKHESLSLDAFYSS